LPIVHWPGRAHQPHGIINHVRRGRHLRDPHFAFGTGIRSWIIGLPMKLDVAWATDLDQIKRPRWHFSIGPEF